MERLKWSILVGGGAKQKHNAQKPSRFSLRGVTMAKLIRTNKPPSSPPLCHTIISLFPAKMQTPDRRKENINNNNNNNNNNDNNNNHNHNQK